MTVASLSHFVCATRWSRAVAQRVARVRLRQFVLVFYAVVTDSITSSLIDVTGDALIEVTFVILFCFVKMQFIEYEFDFQVFFG